MGGGEQPHGIGALPLRVGVGKEPADVTRGGGTEQRISERVGHSIGVGVSDQAPV